MRLADTAAWPSISAPTMPTAGPIREGTRVPASLMRKKAASMIQISVSTLNGTRERVSAMDISRSAGSTWLWWVVTAR